MKKRLCALAFLVFGIMFVISCSKNNKADSSSSSSSQTTPEKKLYNSVLGKWNMTFQNIGGRINTEHLQSIEFLADSSFILTDADGNVETGRFTVKDATTVILTGVATISKISFSNNNINFLLYYYSNTQSFQVTANKATEVPVTDSTRLLCRNWYIYSTYYVNDQNPYDSTDIANIYKEDSAIDKATVLFSPSGTYLVQNLFHNKVVSAETANWQWSQKTSNGLVYWWGGDSYLPEYEEDGLVKITKLTTDELRLEESYYNYYNNDSVLVTTRYVLKPESGNLIRTRIGAKQSRQYNSNSQKQPLNFLGIKHH